jgi:hypothetical protein
MISAPFEIERADIRKNATAVTVFAVALGYAQGAVSAQISIFLNEVGDIPPSNSSRSCCAPAHSNFLKQHTPSCLSQGGRGVARPTICLYQRHPHSRPHSGPPFGG